jgi:hypothetical protein
MSNKKFLIAWAVLFVVWMVGSYAVHGALLRADYMQLANLFRPEPEAAKYFPLMILAHVLLAGAFVWIYQRGRENKAWLGQGIRFGIAVALLTVGRPMSSTTWCSRCRARLSSSRSSSMAAWS